MSSDLVMSCLETMHHRVCMLEAESDQVFIVGVKRDPNTGQEYAAHLQETTDDILSGVLFVLRHSADQTVLRANLEILGDHATDEFKQYYQDFHKTRGAIPEDLEAQLSLNEQADLRKFDNFVHKVPRRTTGDNINLGLRYYAYILFHENPKLLLLSLKKCETFSV